MLEPDYEVRAKYCKWFLDFIKTDEVLNHTYFTDEAWIHLSGFVNTQTYRIWDTKNPHVIIQSPLHPQKIGVWCAISSQKIIGPIFFTKKINSIRYVRILEKFISHIDPEEIENIYFQQDGATAHTAFNTAAHLENYFANRLIAKSSRKLETLVDFPARSPDLTSPDFFCGDI